MAHSPKLTTETVIVTRPPATGKSAQQSVGGWGADLQLLEQVSKSGRAGRFRRTVVFCEVVADLLSVTLAVPLAYVIYRWLSLGKQIHYPTGAILGSASLLATIMVLMLDRVGAYRRGNSLLRVRETEQVLRVSTEAFAIIFAVSFFNSILFSRWLLVLCVTLVPLALLSQKFCLYLLIRGLHSRGYGIERVLIYGSGYTGRRVFSVLKRSPKLGLDPVAFADDDPAKAGSTVCELGYERRRSAPVASGPLNKDFLHKHSIDMVIVAIPSIKHQKFADIMDASLRANVRVSFVPGQLLPTSQWMDYQDIDGVLLASVGKLSSWGVYDAVKRLCDLLGSLVIIVLGIPVFLLLTMVIKIESRGPAFFRQQRIGKDGRPFWMYKFRTMRTTAAPYDYSPLSSNDPRITKVGKFVRRTSLDELPQLLNVLQGRMSLVGPRPEMPFIVAEYTPAQRQRLQVKPGITGLWQLSGDRAFLIHENIEYDLYYIQHRNLFMDLAILLHTSVFAMRGI